MLTAIGADIVVRARNILVEAEQIRQMAKAAKDPFIGELKLGAFPTLAPYMFPRIVPVIREKLPLMKLTLIEDKTEHLLLKLQKGEIDCALIALPVGNDTYEVAEIYWEEFLLAVPAAHPLAKKKAVALDDLVDQPMLLLDDGHCLREQSLALCKRIGTGESGSYRATSLETLRNMIAAGTGMTFMPKLAVKASDDICYLPFKKPFPGRMIALVYRKGSGRSVLFDSLQTVMSQALL